MSITVIKEQMSKLSRKEQTELMHYMIELLASGPFELSAAWSEEIERREQSLESGTSKGKPAKDVIAKYVSE